MMSEVIYICGKPYLLVDIGGNDNSVNNEGITGRRK